MRVIVAKTAGFCWGVRRAMDAVLEASARQKGVQTLGPLIHNPQALEIIRRRGVGVVDTPGEVAGGTVVIRAHGIPIQDLRGLKARQDRGELRIVNATCPEVAKVHSRIKRWSSRGYFTVILGTHGHAESVAHQSFAEAGSAIVADLEEAKALPDEKLAKVLVLAQTTFTDGAFREISEYIRSRSGECIVENTICRDTSRRQAEARELACTVDYVVIVGGRNSANTKHLAELARANGKPCQFVETADELDRTAFSGHETVGVLAGASTPTWLVEEVVDALGELGHASGRLTRLLDSAFRTPMVLALGAALLTLGTHAWMGLPRTWGYPAIAGAYVLAMYLLAPYMNPMGLGYKGPGRARFLERNRFLMMGVALAALALALGLAAILGIGSLIVLGGASILGLLYKRRIRLGRRELSLQAIPGSKDVLVALALAVVAVALPLWHFGRPWNARAWGAVLLVSALVFARTAIYNLRDMQNDQILGKETLPILVGRRATKLLLALFLALALAVSLPLSLMQAGRHAWPVALVLVLACAYPVLYLWLYHERFSVGRHVLEPPVELGFYVAGLLALL